MTEQENIFKGTVTLDRIIYPKGTNGNCWGIISAEILEREGEEDTEKSDFFSYNFITLKGELPTLDFGQTYKVVAKEVEDKYGSSYSIQMMLPHNPLKNDKQWKLFLSTIIAPNLVERIFTTLENPIEVISGKNIEELCKVKGIKEATAKRVISKYEENLIYGEAFAELVTYNISINLIKKIVDTYDGNLNKALNIIRTNPYQLAIDVEGVGFETADTIGKKIGIPNNDVNRIKSFIYYWLSTQAYEGYSWVTPNTLCEVVTAYLQLTDNINLKVALKEMKEQELLHWNIQENYVCLKKNYDLDLNIATELERLIATNRVFEGRNFDEVVKETEEQKGYEFTEEQKESAKKVLENAIGIITGGSGVGKTSTAKLVLDCLRDKYRVLACSFSGKASYRIYEATGFKGKTIHSTLEYNPQFKAFMRNRENKLGCDVMLIDECSFLDEELFYSLLQALPDGCKLIMLGDPNQLEPIGIGSLLSDMINSGVINTNHLTKIHRQAAKSGIIVKANEVSEGKQITNSSNSVEVYGELQDLTVITKPAEDLQDYAVNLFKQEYEKYNDITKVQGLSALRTRGKLSLEALNNKIQEWYNPHKDNEEIVITRNGKPAYFRVGDKVINTKNNYSAMTENGDNAILYNGMTGIIKSINTYEKSMIINFGDDIGNLYIESDWLPNIELAYFCTVFKYQGSECDSCVIALDMSAYTLLTRNLVYTGLTRAKKNCILICENQAIKKAISTNNVVKKQTFLCNMLKIKLGEKL